MTNRREDPHKPGRLKENDEASRAGRAMFARGGIRNGATHRRSPGGRVGSFGGQRAQTFHARFGAVRRHIGGLGRAGAGIDYITREGDYGDRDDLEHVAGDKMAMGSALLAVEAACKRRDERVMLTAVVELPLASTPVARRDIAVAIIENWRQRGHEAIAAVHALDGNPHIHVAVTARPVFRQADGSFGVDRAPHRRPWKNRDETRAERAILAGLVNGAMHRHRISAPLFHPGKLRSYGANATGGVT